MATTMHMQIEVVISCLSVNNVTASSFVLSLLEDSDYVNHPCTEDLVQQMHNIFEAFEKHYKLLESAMDWAKSYMECNHSNSINQLAHVNGRFDFGALHTSEHQLKTFQIEDMACEIEDHEPAL
ncbi:hypothetical protein FIBSPDRAFT_946680 [Athelia psychrophila]|uniref:Uncharacterized protein n=1 Tax=Athelia psychrophila TaxID=1759441 RepID=A0A166STJ2_9AGAM|nr:hypothetical protein FIBSPDRAFT_946680 [Fibularhizoctonia sp. CBS 109695]